MNAIPTTPAKKSPVRKLVMQLVIGALTGAAVTFAVLSGLEGSGVDLGDSARMGALLTGLILAVIGLFVGLGIMAPKAGSRILNVEDADEIREQRTQLGLGSLVMLLGGLGLMALAVARVDGEPGLLSAQAALIFTAICFVTTAALAYMSRSGSDELMRSLSAEAAVLTVYALLVIAGVWATLAHLGYADWITPLGFLAGLTMIQLLAVFWVVGRRGLLKPR
jgi:hypothetical protein